MKERLDRFTLVNLLYKTPHKPKNMSLSHRYYDFDVQLSELPTRWWLSIHTEPHIKETVWRLFNEMVDYVISIHQDHLYRQQTFDNNGEFPFSHGIQTDGPSALLANQAAHHIAEYVRSNWNDHIDDCYRTHNLPQSWLNGLSQTGVSGVESFLDRMESSWDNVLGFFGISTL